MKQKRKSENGILALFRYAAVAMSLLSWYTTSDGFKNTVFASNPHADITATLASLAIQTVLLAGVLKYGPIVMAIWDRCRRRLASVELKVNIREHKKWEISKFQYEFLQKDHKGRIKISNIKIIGKNVLKGIVNLFIDVFNIIVNFLRLFIDILELLKNIVNIKDMINLIKAALIVFFYFILEALVTLIIAAALVTSISFSYISIVNTMYADDFAVNSNIVMESFMRETVSQMRADNQEYLEALREKVVDGLKEDGQEIINTSVEKNQEKYAKTTAKILEIGRRDTLIDINLKQDGIKKQKKIKTGIKGQEIYIQEVKERYVEKEYKDFIRKHNLNSSQFASGITSKINNLNNDMYKVYCRYYYQYSEAVKRYNIWIDEMQGNNKPTLEEMQSLSYTCENMKISIQRLLLEIEAISSDGTRAPTTTKRLVEEAYNNVKTLLTAVEDVQGMITSMINSSYGENSLSFSEIIAAFGSTGSSEEILDNARMQMLQMQGTILAESNQLNVEDTKNKKSTKIKKVSTQNDTERSEVEKVTELMEDINNYVEAVKYANRAEALGQQLEINYNIISEREKEKQERDSEQSSDREQNEGDSLETVSNMIMVSDSSVKKVLTTTGSSAVTDVSIGENRNEGLDKNIDVTPDEWTRVRKKQMTALTGLIFDSPVKMYCSEVEVGKLKEYFKQEEIREKEENEENLQKDKSEENGAESYLTQYNRYKVEADNFRKNYLDTSDMEKAYNLVWGDENYFPYKIKAQVSLFFAIFLDLGAFAIGFLMFLMEYRKVTEKRKKYLFINDKFMN